MYATMSPISELCEDPLEVSHSPGGSELSLQELQRAGEGQEKLHWVRTGRPASRTLSFHPVQIYSHRGLAAATGHGNSVIRNHVMCGMVAPGSSVNMLCNIETDIACAFQYNRLSFVCLIYLLFIPLFFELTKATMQVVFPYMFPSRPAFVRFAEGLEGSGTQRVVMKMKQIRKFSVLGVGSGKCG
ncbi:hypothetical protein JEQ12_020280 [Ovis aries]|uniref:Uncharacterized protein n=1 Tax=Ovis aries TaxID=9940 RepID=A0A835ZKS3_SHEEP|nr:hypothetical protein JEQ12_020280 [Ovis aries]